MSDYLTYLPTIAEEDVAGLNKAEQSYGDSWRRRGGVSAFFNIDRKIDRLLKQCEKSGWNIFAAVTLDNRAEGAIDDIRDLRRYLMLVEAHLRSTGEVDGKQAGSAAPDKARGPERELSTRNVPYLSDPAMETARIGDWLWRELPDGVAPNTKFLPNGKIWEWRSGVREPNVSDMTDKEYEAIFF